MSTRYAVYYTPSPDGALWQLASAWFGRDSHTDKTVTRAHTPEISAADLHDATAKPARYGFHATLVAPFELAQDCDEAELSDDFARFCGERSKSSVGLEVDRLHDFLALVSPNPEPKLNELAAACVQHFDRFREPLTEYDVARRDTPALTALERSLLKRWGYPYVLEAFRFHLSLTGSLPEPAIERLRPALASLFAELLQQPVAIDGLTLSKQSDRNSPFRCIARHRFTKT